MTIIGQHVTDKETGECLKFVGFWVTGKDGFEETQHRTLYPATVTDEDIIRDMNGDANKRHHNQDLKRIEYSSHTWFIGDWKELCG